MQDEIGRKRGKPMIIVSSGTKRVIKACEVPAFVQPPKTRREPVTLAVVIPFRPRNGS
jgi:hypothetical protein